MFRHLECGEEIKRNERSNLETFLLNRNIELISAKLQPELQELLNQTLALAFNFPENFPPQPEDHCSKWSFYNSLFFSFTIVSTIGYGHQFPATNNGRWACIIYALIGIPLNGILIGSIGSVHYRWFQTLTRTWDGDESKEENGMKGNLFFTIFLKGFLFFTVFTSIFLFLPAKLLQQMESRKNWSYTCSFYFTFVTLSTIGFGDMVAGEADENEEAVWSLEKTCYRIFIILWIIFGMGYVWGVVELISKTLKLSGQPVVKIWKKIFEEIDMEDKENADNDINGAMDRMGDNSDRKRLNRISVSLNNIKHRISPDNCDELERDSLRSLRDHLDWMPKLVAYKQTSFRERSQSSFRERRSSQLFQMRKNSRSRSGQELRSQNDLNPLTAICEVFHSIKCIGWFEDNIIDQLYLTR